MVEELRGKVAVVTGGANGIGRGIVELFRHEGAAVVIGDIDVDRGEALAESLGSRVVFQRADVVNEPDVAALVDRAVGEFGALDIMVNNAGALGDQTPLLDLDADGYANTVNLLLRSAVLGHKHAGRQMRKQESGGSIVSIASIAAIQAGLSSPSYDTSKAAMIQLARTATHELGEFKIRSNVIMPGLIVTALPARGTALDPARYPEFIEGLKARLASVHPMGRGGLPSDIANMAVFFGSDRSTFVSGQSIAVDGGLTAVTKVDMAEVVADVFAEIGAGDVDPNFSAAAKAKAGDRQNGVG